MKRRLRPPARIATAAAALVLGASVLASGPTHADPIVIPTPVPPVIDVEQSVSCLQLTPHAIAPTNKRVRLDVRVLLDGAKKSVAKRAVKVSRKAYAPLGVSLAASYERVKFKTRSATGLNQAAKRHYGGKRPKGIDIVYTLTSKDINGGPPNGNNVAGLADCIGGVRFAKRAFAVGEVFPTKMTGSTVPLPITEGTGKTMAHEIGHLMGGHHHYFSIEGLLAAEPNVATLMGPTLSIISLRFSTLNGLMVRGHAQEYADR